MSDPILVRIGLPLTGGSLVAHALARGLPVLMSANAFARRYPRGHQRAGSMRGFRTQLQHLRGLNCALDSAGFCATSIYRGFPWSVEQYVDLAASFPFAWWASMDLCNEPEVAHDKATRMLRLAETVRLYISCCNAAARRGIGPPTPVLQGFEPAEYVTCARMLPIESWPALVGVGSMCRRNVHGPQGLLAVLEALDAELPSHVKLHVFGVKSGALSYLARFFSHRVEATDSCAWDVAARAEFRTGRTMERRIAHMERWRTGQSIQQRRQVELPPKSERQSGWPAGPATVRDIVGERLANQILDGVVTYNDAVGALAVGGCWAQAFAAIHRLDATVHRSEIEAWLEEEAI
jgi:hypothetical protein